MATSVGALKPTLAATFNASRVGSSAEMTPLGAPWMRAKVVRISLSCSGSVGIEASVAESSCNSCRSESSRRDSER